MRERSPLWGVGGSAAKICQFTDCKPPLNKASRYTVGLGSLQQWIGDAEEPVGQGSSEESERAMTDQRGHGIGGVKLGRKMSVSTCKLTPDGGF